MGGPGGLEFLEILLSWPKRLGLDDLENLVFTSSCAGRSDAANPNDVAVYRGEFRVSLEQGPVVRFQPEGSVAASRGSGTWWFYSPFPPLAPATYHRAVAIGQGRSVYVGSLTGHLPTGPAAIPGRTSLSASIRMYR